MPTNQGMAGVFRDLPAFVDGIAVQFLINCRNPGQSIYGPALRVSAWSLGSRLHLPSHEGCQIAGIRRAVGAGTVGPYAVQLASHAGGTVIATASGDNEA
jgi:hypothetical protein